MKLYDVIKEMSVTELAEFLADNDGEFSRHADDLICNRCRQSNGGNCPCEDNRCFYEKWSNADGIREWLMQEVQDET